MEQTVALDLKQVSIKCKSKKELYEILASDWGIYMPPIQFANCGYVRVVVTGEVKVRFKWSNKYLTLASEMKRRSDNHSSTNKITKHPRHIAICMQKFWHI